MANFQIKDLSSDSNPLGTDLFLKSSGNGALTKITFSDLKESLQGKTNKAIAIMATGNTHAAIAAGQAVYVQNHSSLSDGLYWANAAIGTNATLSTSNLTADVSGGLNKLKGDIDSLNSNITASAYETLLNDSIAVVADGSWQTFTTTVDLSNAKYIIMIVGSHGAIYNEIVIPIGAVTNVGLEHFAYAYWDATDLGQIRLNRNGTVNVLAKTGNLAFDYRIYKAI